MEGPCGRQVTVYPSVTDYGYIHYYNTKNNNIGNNIG